MISSKLPNIGTSIFAKMSKLAADHNAINLSQGFPDFDCHPVLTELVTKYMREAKNQYAPMPGVFELRQAIARKNKELYGHTYDVEKEVTVTAGATQGIYTVISAFIKEDDEVIVFEPAYDSYTPAIKMNGGKPVYVQLQHPNYSINWNAVKRSINSRTRMIILNSPHNPTGAVLKKEDVDALNKLVNGSQIIVLSDEVYEHIIFDGKIHHSLAAFPKLAERTIILSSFGKTYHTTGWKMGYCLAPATLMSEIRKIHQFMVFSANTPIQYAYAEFMQQKHHYEELGAFYQQKRDFFVSLFKGSKFKTLKSSGTYFQLVDYSQVSKERDTDFADRLTIENKVASIPVSVFYHQSVDRKVLRFCFAKSEDTMSEAVKRLREIE